MPFLEHTHVWMNGTLVPWADAKIHVASHVIHYGTAVFEGMRCYDTTRGSACFRLDAHLRRLVDSARVYRMECPFSRAALEAAVLDTIKANGHRACYIRPLVYRGYEALGVNPLSCPVEVAILTWEWGAYLGDGSIEHGVDARVSSWARMAPNTFPALAKATANYANSGLIKMEALTDGYAEGIALDTSGRLSEGSGQNLFLVRDGVVLTPPLSASILPGITRDSVITLARDLGIEVREQALPRELLYIADEVFFAGTAVEVTPVRSVDRIPVGTGEPGPVTMRIQRAFFDLLKGDGADSHGWLTFVHGARGAAPVPAAAQSR